MTQTSKAARHLALVPAPPKARPVKFVMTPAKEDEFRRRYNVAMERLGR